MVNKNMLGLGTTRSCIRELFEFGLRQASIVGKENVYDFSIGNPNVPAPAVINEVIDSPIVASLEIILDILLNKVTIEIGCRRDGCQRNGCQRTQ